MSYRIVAPALLLMLLLSFCVFAQTKSYSHLNKESSKARADVIRAATEYKESLDRLLALQQEEVKRAEAEVENRRAMLAHNMLNEHDVKSARSTLAEKKAKVEETLAKMKGADTLIQEVRREEAASMASPRTVPPPKARAKKPGIRPPAKRSKKPLCKECKDV